MNDNINAREVEFLKKIPEDRVMETIEKHGEQLREIIERKPDVTDQELMRELAIGYRGL